MIERVIRALEVRVLVLPDEVLYISSRGHYVQQWELPAAVTTRLCYR